MKQAEIKVYTREAQKTGYPNGLAYSVHFASRIGDGEFKEWNRNYGILFAAADIREDNTLATKVLKNPKMIAMENSYGIVAERFNEDGSVDKDSENKLLLWTTKNFMAFEEKGLVEASSLAGYPQADRMEVGHSVAWYALQHWSPVKNIGVKLPKTVEVSSKEELDAIKATFYYSDGSEAEKRISWNTEDIDFTKAGTYQVKGRISQTKFPFPVAKGYGDPVIFPWEGKWYYISTNDNTNDIGLYAREADKVEDLFAEDVTEHLILAQDEKRQLMQTFWAPEFHVIGGELYILFAVSGNQWGPQCHVMKLKKGRSIIEADSWEDPIPVVRADGSPLAEGAITLDMTYIKTERQSYMVWSYRVGIGTPLDSGSMLYIATVDEQKPWQLTGEPVLLSRPLWGWENLDGTINNEGPYAFQRNGKVYLCYSGGSANAYTYTIGLLTANACDDLCDVSVWSKRGTPVVSFYSVKGEYGPGHNSFYEDEEGNLMIAYHGELGLEEHLRCDGIRRVHFGIDGEPVFDMSADEDLDERFRDVELTVVVR